MKCNSNWTIYFTVMFDHNLFTITLHWTAWYQLTTDIQDREHGMLCELHSLNRYPKCKINHSNLKMAMVPFCDHFLGKQTRFNLVQFNDRLTLSVYVFLFAQFCVVFHQYRSDGGHLVCPFISFKWNRKCAMKNIFKDMFAYKMTDLKNCVFSQWVQMIFI